MIDLMSDSTNPGVHHPHTHPPTIFNASGHISSSFLIRISHPPGGKPTAPSSATPTTPHPAPHSTISASQPLRIPTATPQSKDILADVVYEKLLNIPADELGRAVTLSRIENAVVGDIGRCGGRIDGVMGKLRERCAYLEIIKTAIHTTEAAKTAAPHPSTPSPFQANADLSILHSIHDTTTIHLASLTRELSTCLQDLSHHAQSCLRYAEMNENLGKELLAAVPLSPSAVVDADALDLKKIPKDVLTISLFSGPIIHVATREEQDWGRVLDRLWCDVKSTLKEHIEATRKGNETGVEKLGASEDASENTTTTPSTDTVTTVPTADHPTLNLKRKRSNPQSPHLSSPSHSPTTSTPDTESRTPLAWDTPQQKQLHAAKRGRYHRPESSLDEEAKRGVEGEGGLTLEDVSVVEE
ncbi:hypothetical protein HK102_000135, partial [Quaeritorhiza haematococci]